MGFRGRVFRAIQRSPAVAEVARRLARVRPARKAGTIWTAKPFSMMGYRRLSRLYDLANGLERDGVVGSLVECGVRNGGSSAVIASAVRENSDRGVWLFDSWDGLPEPSTADYSLRSGRQGEKGMLPSSIDTVRHLMFTTFNLDQSRIHLVQGWFEETIPPIATDLAPIAFLVLDCSWYESYRFCLNELYDRVAKGGIVWLDGYGSWHGCRQAVDEFIAQRQLNVTLHPVPEDDAGFYMAVYLHKP